jgi:replicative DNA helicase
VSAHLEHALLSRIVIDRDLHSVEKAQIDESYFTVSEAREIFRYLQNVFHAPDTTGMVPSADMIKTRFPAFYCLENVPDPVPLLCSQLRYRRVQGELLQFSHDLAVGAQADPAAAVAHMKMKAAEISAISDVGQDLNISSAASMFWNDYNLTEQSRGVVGIPYPWEPLTHETQGMQGGQFIVIYGRPKNMKTWIALWIAVHAYVYARRRVLIYTREMPIKQVFRRVISAIARVDYDALRKGLLPVAMRDHVLNVMNQLAYDEQVFRQGSGRQPYIIVTTDSTGGTRNDGGGVSWLQAKIRELQPDIVVVDGMYLMRDDRSKQRTIDWKQIAHISQDLKLTSQEFDIPIIGTTQAHRGAEKTKGEDLTELSYSDALGQDADAVYRTIKREVVENGVKKTLIYLTAPGMREGRFTGIVLDANPGIEFECIKVLADLSEVADAPDTPPQRHQGKSRASSSPFSTVQPNSFQWQQEPKLPLPK